MLCRLIFLGETINGRLVILRTFGITRKGVVPRSAREVRRIGMIGARQCAPRNAVVVDVVITSPFSAELRELFGVQHFAAANGLLRILERIGHPIVHAEVEIAHYKDGSLELLG